MMTLPGYTALALPTMTVNETTSQKQINRNNYRRSYGSNNPEQKQHISIYGKRLDKNKRS